MHLVFSLVRRVNSAPGHVPTVPLGLNLVASGGNESSFPSFFVLPGGIAETKRSIVKCKFDRIPSLQNDVHALERVFLFPPGTQTWVAVQRRLGGRGVPTTLLRSAVVTTTTTKTTAP